MDEATVLAWRDAIVGDERQYESGEITHDDYWSRVHARDAALRDMPVGERAALQSRLQAACDAVRLQAPQRVCRYSLAHQMKDVPAVTTVDCGIIGIVDACEVCADLYAQIS